MTERMFGSMNGVPGLSTPFSGLTDPGHPVVCFLCGLRVYRKPCPAASACPAPRPGTRVSDTVCGARLSGARLLGALLGGRMYQVLYSAVDYLRVVIQPWQVSDMGGPDLVWARLMAAMGERDDKVAHPRRARMGPYDGWAAVGAFAGTDTAGGMLVQIPGQPADRAVTSGAWPGKPSRLDLQVTSFVGDRTNELIEQEYERMLSVYRDRPGGRFASAPRLVKAEGFTAYSGARSRCGSMLRIYNCGHKHGEARPELIGTVRYEVELTGRRAQSASVQMGGQAWDQEAIAGAVRSEAERRGALMPCQGTGDQALRLSAPRMRPGERSTLKWMERQVAPAIAKLLESGVPRTTILAALGLSGSARYVDGSTTLAPVRAGIKPVGGAGT